VQYCNNLAAISGIYFVGGIVGEKQKGFIGSCINNGTIFGGNFVGGVVGKVTDFVHHKYLKNAGTIHGGGDNTSYIGGIAGYVYGSSQFVSSGLLHGLTNIGVVQGGNYQYAGGIVGYLQNSNLENCSGGGYVSGAVQFAGGIVGFVDVNGIIKSCISTNKVERDGVPYSGALVGFNEGLVDSSYFDSQMGNIDGIGRNNGIHNGPPMSRTTAGMLGLALQFVLP